MKEDKFAETAEGAMKWARGHQQGSLWAILAALVVIGLGTGFYFWNASQSEKANMEMSKAMRTFNARLRGPDSPAGGDESYATMAERGKAAEKEFQAIADKYSMTKPGKMAKYLAAVSLLQAGDPTAEQQLKSIADSGNSDTSGLAKMALASLYRSTKREGEAAKIYSDLTAHPTSSVSKAAAQLAMAEMYETSDPKQAEKLYQDIQKENKDNSIGQLAQSKLAPRGGPPQQMQVPQE
jgi:Flp pilus assembly protein TadB